MVSGPHECSRYPLRWGNLRLRLAGAAALAATWAGSCGEREEPRREATADARAPAAASARDGGSRGAGVPPAPLLGEEPVSSTELGALHGEILFRGEAPARFLLGASENKDCQHHPDVDQRSNVILVQDGRLENAYVYVKSGPFDEGGLEIPPPPVEPVVLDQKGCMYLPRVVTLRAGQTLRVQNSDPTNHNVNLKAPRNDVIDNRNMGAGQPPLAYVFEKREHEIAFKCDIHPWMGAVAFVEEHPWFAVSDARGAFRIGDVPPGEYVVEAIHEELGKVRGSVKVAAGRSTGFTLTFER